MSIKESIDSINSEIGKAVTLVAVSKTHSVEVVRETYQCGQRHFGENKVQELTEKAAALPADVRWHMIGHLQTNKVKFIVPFVYLIHGVDSVRLLKTVDKEAAKISKVVSCLLQVHIADESTKFGFSEDELIAFLESAGHQELKNVQICGLMGMATFTDDIEKVRSEFKSLHHLYSQIKQKFFSHYDAFAVLSMGMSDDYKVAIEEGSNMIRVGSKIFGHRSYDKPQ